MNKYWYQEQVRILQTVLREKDAAQYDAAAVVRYMKETDSNCLVVNAGGVMDFFPNKTELGRPGRFLGSQDILKSLVKECHESAPYNCESRFQGCGEGTVRAKAPLVRTE